MSSSAQRRVSVRNVVDVIWSRVGVSAFYRECGVSAGREIMVTLTRMLVYKYARNMFK